MSIRARAQEGTLTFFSPKDDRDCYRTRFGGFSLAALRGPVGHGHDADDDERHCWVVSGRSAPLVPVLAELITRPDTPLDADVKNQIASQLDSAARRFAAIGHEPEPETLKQGKKAGS